MHVYTKQYDLLGESWHPGGLCSPMGFCCPLKGQVLCAHVMAQFVKGLMHINGGFAVPGTCAFGVSLWVSSSVQFLYPA